MVESYFHWFPNWKTKLGGLTRGDVLNLLELLTIRPREFLISKSWKEAKEFRSSDTRTLLIFHSKPTDHCWRVLETGFVDGSPDEILLVMIPDVNNGKIERKLVRDIETQHDPEYVVIVHKSIQSLTLPP